jgi:hypothetical protein
MGISGNHELARLLSWQAGVVSCRQALGLGMTEGELRHRTRPGGPWRRLLPGVYVTATGEPTIDQLDMAAVLYAGPGAVITGLAALRRHAVRAPASPLVDVLMPHRVRRVPAAYVRLHRVRQMPVLATSDGEIRFVFVPRAVIDAARWMSDLREVRAVMCGAVQQGRCSVEHLAAELAEPRLPGSALARRVLAEVSHGIRSPAEGDLMDLLGRSGLPEPLYNPRLYLGKTLLAVPDAWWPQAAVVVEVDSREWHLSARDWAQTMARHGRMTAAGISVLHFSPSQIRHEGDKVITQIRDALRNGRPAGSITTVPVAA